MLLGNGKGDSRRGNVEWFQCSLDMRLFLQIQLRCKKKRSLERPWRNFFLKFTLIIKKKKIGGIIQAGNLTVWIQRT